MPTEVSLNDLSTFVSTGSDSSELETIDTAIECSEDAACCSEVVSSGEVHASGADADEPTAADEASTETAVNDESRCDLDPPCGVEQSSTPEPESAGAAEGDFVEELATSVEAAAPLADEQQPLAEADTEEAVPQIEQLAARFEEPAVHVEEPIAGDSEPVTGIAAATEKSELASETIVASDDSDRDIAPVADTEATKDVEAIEGTEDLKAAEDAEATKDTATVAEAADVDGAVPVEGSASDEPACGFTALKLRDEVLQTVLERGYSQPTPIQAETIPYILEGRDVFGQAQTGTGKTAAFALPLLSRLDLSQKAPQVLVLAPTRELALQVSESFERYGAGLDGFRCTAIYGGSDFYPQIRDLRQGVHVVVGTPGRVIDHMKRGTLQLNQLKTIVLDEADEMLRMGFVDDVTWVLSQTPEERQVALFSATLPEPIRRIAREHQRDPKEIRIESEVRTAETVRQRSLLVNWRDKVDALARILEVEPTDGVIVFVATKSTTTELADQLIERGFSATPLNGDIPQNLRERTVEQLKAGRVDVIVATDVAARGLDVSRVSHVINFDIPTETESYVHRIGRTGRAGRSGEAILFVKPQERRHVRRIEQATGQRIEHMQLPSVDEVNEVRLAKFKQRITETLEAGNLDFFTGLINQYQQETNTPPWQVAAALAKLMQGDTPLLMEEPPRPKREPKPERQRDRRDESSSDRPPRQRRDRTDGERSGRSDEGMERFRIEVGFTHGVRPGNIVGAIANEAGLDGSNIGRVSIFDDHSTVDLPLGMPKEIFLRLKQTWVSGRQLRITRVNGRPPQPTQRAHAGIKGKRQFHKKKPQQHGKRKSRRES